jgi:Spy/CpxP family protein refolding chaperone
MKTATESDTSALPRPAGRVAILSIGLVFVCGILLGALAMSLIHPHGLHSPPPGMPMSTAEWKQKLDLTDEQERRLKSVLDDFSLYYDNLLADGNTRILQILKPDQKAKFEQMMADHKATQKASR